MKNRQIDQTTSQQAGICSDRKRPTIGLLVLCLLIGIGVIITMALLGECLGRVVGTDSYVISLVPPEASSMESADEEIPGLSIHETEQTMSGQDTAAAGATPSRQTYGNTSYTAAGPNEYHGELQVYDDVQVWNSETRVDLFKNNYDGTVQSGDAEKIIAPGTSNFYDFTLKNNGNIPLDYSISLEVGTILGEQDIDSSIPLEWRLLDGGGAVLSDWQEYNEIARVLEQDTLKVRRQNHYTIEWRWGFERGGNEDVEDTAMGNLSAEQLLGVKAVIYVYAEQSAEPDDGTPDFMEALKTGDSLNILLYIVLMVISACGILIYFARKKAQKNGWGCKE